MTVGETLLILGTAADGSSVADQQVVHAASSRVFVVLVDQAARDLLRTDSAVAFVGDLPPADLLRELGPGERLFVDGWLAGRKPKDRVGEGLPWDAPGMTPPDRPAPDEDA